MSDAELRRELNGIKSEQKLMREDIIRICTRCHIFHANGHSPVVKAIMMHWQKVLGIGAFVWLFIKSSGNVQAEQIKALQEAVRMMLANW